MRSCWSRCGTAGRRANRLPWTRVHDLPDFVFFNHEIHVNKGHRVLDLPRPRGPDAHHVRAEHAADGVVPELPSQSGEEPAADQRDLQHGVDGPSSDNPVWCAAAGEDRCAHRADGHLHHHRSERGGVNVAALHMPRSAAAPSGGERCWCGTLPPAPVSYMKFTDQDELGHFLAEHYHIRNPRELTVARFVTDERSEQR